VPFAKRVLWGVKHLNIENKVVVITGGASGLGAGTARYFVEEKGAKVSLFDINAEAGNELVSEIGSEHALFVPVDVTDEDSVRSGIQRTVDKFEKIHVGINCAGIPSPSKILDRSGQAIELQKFKAVIDVNLVGLFNVMSKCAEVMAKNEPDAGGERGAFVNVSSGAAFEGQIGQSAYAASKSGVLGLNFPAARELGRYGIRVNSIAPGLFNTPMLQSLDQQVIESLVSNVDSPKRAGSMEEFAHTCAYMVENGYLNGENIRLDAVTRLQAK